MEQSILRERIDHIAIIKINRPSAYNALSREMIDQLDEELEKIQLDKTIRALIVTGDRNFAAGADIAGMVDCSLSGAKAFSFTVTFSKLENMRIPTIAAICGYALGGGFELALACDLRIASEDAQMGLPEINLGIIPGAGGTVRLPRLIGEAKAKELIYLGSRVNASAALQYGMINKVVQNDKLMEEAMALAQSLAEKAPLALCAAKEAIQCGQGENRLEAMQKEAEIWSGLFSTFDQKEGMRAFLEKRKPQYQGK